MTWHRVDSGERPDVEILVLFLFEDGQIEPGHFDDGLEQPWWSSRPYAPLAWAEAVIGDENGVQDPVELAAMMASLADRAAVGDVESLSISNRIAHELWWNTLGAIGEGEEATMQAALRYLELRGMLRNHPKNQALVQVVEDGAIVSPRNFPLSPEGAETLLKLGGGL